MQKATALLAEAEKRGEGSFKPYVNTVTHYCITPLIILVIQELTSTMKRDYEQVTKDNNFIYNDLVPDFNTLEPPGKATLAKPVQFTSPAANFQDLFKDLMPLAVSQAMSAYATKKEEFVSTELERLRDATHNLNEYVIIPN